MALYFNASKLPDSVGEYVAWMDGMGTGHALASSLPMAANFVMKLHLAFAQVATPEGVHIYPVMDGVYVTSPDRDVIQAYLRDAYKSLAKEFTENDGVLKRFMVRTGIAYGATIHGDEIDEAAFTNGKPDKFTKEVSERLGETRPRLLLGSAMVNAYRSERKAAPFGFYVHDSALTLPQIANKKDVGFEDRYWKWWLDDAKTKIVASSLAKQVQSYLKEASRKTRSLAYPVDRLKEHREAFDEYYADLLGGDNLTR